MNCAVETVVSVGTLLVVVEKYFLVWLQSFIARIGLVFYSLCFIARCGLNWFCYDSSFGLLSYLGEPRLRVGENWLTCVVSDCVVYINIIMAQLGGIESLSRGGLQTVSLSRVVLKIIRGFCAVYGYHAYILLGDYRFWTSIGVFIRLEAPC